jgi:hypothetical protein
MKAANARFWVWHLGGWVKLTLRPDQQLETCHGDTHEEGYSCESVRWTHEADHVRQEWSTWGRDCDGRHESNGKSVCPLAQLKARDLEAESEDAANTGIFVPDWKHGEMTHRDHTAEAAGY